MIFFHKNNRGLKLKLLVDGGVNYDGTEDQILPSKFKQLYRKKMEHLIRLDNYYN